MNAAHLHLMLNHLPVIGIPLGLIMLLLALRKGSSDLRRFSYVFLVAIALISIPAFLSGEGAEEVVEHLPGVSEALIESHEEVAEIAWALTLISGALSLLLEISERLSRWVPLRGRVLTLLVLCLVGASGTLLYTGNLGGQIRHTEIRSDALSAAGVPGGGEAGGEGLENRSQSGESEGD